jgi:4-hydroxy-tetrahydrodipicolinate synthase
MIKTRFVRGIVPVVSTPLTAEEDIDVPALKGLIEFLNTKNIGGLWVLGTGSEDMNLSFAKRIKVAQAACDANAGKTPLLLGTGFFAIIRDSAWSGWIGSIGI